MATQGGAGRCTTAPGTAAAIATSARSASNTGQTASKPTCAALSLRKDTPTARSPATVATPARGTTPRFATTPIVDSWLKWVRVIGSTAIGAATIPAVAANESWNPGSCRSPGRTARITNAARARLLVTDASRSRRSAARTSTAMTTARSTDGSGPTTAAKPMTTTIATTADVRRPTRARWQSANTAAASNATLKPDTART